MVLASPVERPSSPKDIHLGGPSKIRRILLTVITATKYPLNGYPLKINLMLEKNARDAAARKSVISFMKRRQSMSKTLTKKQIEAMTKAQKNENIERQFSEKRREARKKSMRPVKWNGKVFESRNALGRYLKLSSTNIVSAYIKKKMPIKGYIAESVTKEYYQQCITEANDDKEIKNSIDTNY